MAFFFPSGSSDKKSPGIREGPTLWKGPVWPLALLLGDIIPLGSAGKGQQADLLPPHHSQPSQFPQLAPSSPSPPSHSCLLLSVAGPPEVRALPLHGVEVVGEGTGGMS